MKLLFCRSCGDIFRLRYAEKQCECGQTKGRYLNREDAEYSGEHAVPMGIGNYALDNAIRNQPKEGEGKRFDALVIPEICNSFVKSR